MPYLNGARFILTLFFTAAALLASAQVRIASFGATTGITSTFTWDEGIDSDPRYKSRNDIKFSTFGLSYGMEYDGFGFEVNPGLLTTGQNFSVLTTTSASTGVRKITLNYLNVPVALKFHLITLPSTNVSFVGGVSPAILLKGQETISHEAGKYYFPTAVYPILPDNYQTEAGGVVLAPKVSNYKMLGTGDLRTFQLFGFIGVRSDWYFSKNWKASVDFRVNYSVIDSRNKAYLNKLENYQAIYDITGRRRDIVGNVTFGVARYLQLEKKEKDRRAIIRKNTTKYVPPKKLPKPKERKSKLPH
jgi:hypothetical protein